MNGLLSNQVAIVTGGNTGIGKEISFKLVSEGVRLVILGTNQIAGEAVVAEIRHLYPSSEVQFYAVDVSQTNAVDEIVKQILNHYGQVDLLVNNAGITSDQLLMKMSEEEWDCVLNINLKSCFNTCRAVVRAMMKARKGKIINISSVVGLMGNAGQANYAASKAGMVGFSKSLAKELAPRNILVNCIAPGFIQTKMTEVLNEAQKGVILKQIPLGRMGEVGDVANAVWFLASPLSNYITGQVLTVDGGLLM